MALAPILVSRFPDVPNAPGVPPILRDGPGAPQPPALVADSPAVASRLTARQWGLFDANGAPVLVGESVLSWDYRREYRVSDFPIEDGSFRSYNKTAAPFDILLTFTQGGTDADRRAFLASVEALCGGLGLFTAVTPEASYVNVNPTRFDYRRQARGGATLLVVDVTLAQIRVAQAALFSNTRSENGAIPVNVGPVLPLDPNAAQAAVIGAG